MIAWLALAFSIVTAAFVAAVVLLVARFWRQVGPHVKATATMLGLVAPAQEEGDGGR